jgi:hypothetical protein
MAAMELRDSFATWLRKEIGSTAVPALHRHLKERAFRLFACMEHAGTFQREVYHPALGFYRATGQSDHEALLGILRQIWLVDSLQEERGSQVRPAMDP